MMKGNMQWRHATARRNYSCWITSNEYYLQQPWLSYHIRIRQQAHRYYSESMIYPQIHIRNLLPHRFPQKRTSIKVPVISFSSSTLSSSSDSGNNTNVNNDTTKSNQQTPSVSTTSKSLSSNQNNDSPRLTLHLQRMQQKELRRQYRRQQQNRSNNNNKNNYYSSSNPTKITTTSQVQVHPSGREQEIVENNSISSSSSSFVSKDDHQQREGPKFATPEEVKIIIHELYQNLARIVQELNTEASERNGSEVDDTTRLNGLREPLWDIATQQQHPSHVQDDDEDYITMINHRRNIFQRTVTLQQMLYDYTDHQKIIRPGTIHRHEFVALVGMILQIYSNLPANVTIPTTDSEPDTTIPAAAAATVTKPITLYTQTLELIDWIRRPPYRFELSHKQCHAVIIVAAKCQQWTMAAQIYMGHIDPEMAGYIPVPINTISARSFTMDGLFCIAYAATLNKTLPVENVFDGVTKLMMVSPSDTESCTFYFRWLDYIRTIKNASLPNL